MRHGVTPAEAESVVGDAESPYPKKIGDEKWLVIGRGTGGRFVQVIYLLDPDGTVFIIHARPMTDAEKRRYRRRKR
jgi:uncharacterized DUF497 family protein